MKKFFGMAFVCMLVLLLAGPGPALADTLTCDPTTAFAGEYSAIGEGTDTFAGDIDLTGSVSLGLDGAVEVDVAVTGIPLIGVFRVEGAGTLDETGYADMTFDISLVGTKSGSGTLDCNGHLVFEIPGILFVMDGVVNDDGVFEGIFSYDFVWLVHCQGSGDFLGQIESRPGGIWPNTLCADFGSSGLSTYSEAYGWNRKTTANADLVVPVDLDDNGVDEIAASFGASLFTYGAAEWTKLASLGPEQMMAQNDTLVADFGSLGLSRYSDPAVYTETGGWARITTADADLLLAMDLDDDGEDELVMTFGSVMFALDGSTWTKLATTQAEGILAQGNDLIVDFGTFGVSRYSQATGWRRITTADPDLITAVDVDEDGDDELALSFGTAMFILDGSTWTKVATTGAEQMIAAGTDLVVDFGASGLSSYNTTDGWTSLTSADPVLLLAADVYRDGTLDIVITLSDNSMLVRDDGGTWTQISTASADAVVALVR